MNEHARPPRSGRIGRRASAPRVFAMDEGVSKPVAERFSAQKPSRPVAFGDLERPIGKDWPAFILLVDADPVALREVDSRLSDEGYGVAAVSSFHAARRRLQTAVPNLLVTAVRLEAYNGLHLAACLRQTHPNVPIIITHTASDPVLENDARRLGATFIVLPLESPEFLKHVRETVGERHTH